jgi:hypothetical protein
VAKFSFSGKYVETKLSEIIRQPQATVRGDQWHWQEDKDRRLDFYILEQSPRKG